MSIRGKTAIIGYGETEFAKARDSENRSNHTEQCHAAILAIEDAGIRKEDIDGLIALPPLGQTPSWGMDMAEYLQLQPRFIDNLYHGGAAGAAAILYSAAAIKAGLCHTVLLVGGSAMKPGRIFPYDAQAVIPFVHDFDSIYGSMLDNSAYALIKQRYKHEFGVGEEPFAQVVVNARYHASKFPNALLKTPVSRQAVIDSPMICDPLRMFEIVMPCSGAAAVVLTSAEAAGRSNNPPVYLLGGGQSIDRGMWNPAYGRNPSLTTSPIKKSAAQAFAMAGLTIADMDFVQLYDCYTITVIIALEDIGCCEKGQGAKFVENANLTHQGELPVNTDGGQLGRGQPMGACHFLSTVEAARQLMGRAGALQVEGARFGLVNGNGGSMANECTLIFGNQIP